MDDSERRRQAFERYMAMSVSALREQWASEDRTDWAEAALRDALIQVGVQPDELDAIAARREEISEDRPPELRTTLWHYGGVGQMLCYVIAGLVGTALYRLLGMVAATVGVGVVFFVYLCILYRRQELHRGQPMHPLVAFRMKLQFVVPILVAMAVLIGMTAKIVFTR